ncbi:MAG: type I methionyl aminopeptidase [bacterium]|nr:type I methionyl aminopeptidase [bacterium]
MMIIHSDEELNILREGGRRLAHVLEEVKQAVRPGITTKELDRIAEEGIRKAGGEPVFKGYKTRYEKNAFPASLCVSINDEIVHGVPSEKRILKEGDIVGLDIGMRWPVSATSYPRATAPGLAKLQATSKNGLITDMAVTVGVGKISAEAEKLLRVTEESLAKAIAMLKVGVHLGDLGHIIQSHLEAHGLGVVRDLVGHGVGKELHEEPMIPNFGKKGTGEKFVEGQIIAIEPMATLGDYHIKAAPDGWTLKTKDGSLAAHFEHSVVILKDGAEVLTKA